MINGEGILGRLGPGESGPGQLGPIVRFSEAVNWAPDSLAPPDSWALDIEDKIILKISTISKFQVVKIFKNCHKY